MANANLVARVARARKAGSNVHVAAARPARPVASAGVGPGHPAGRKKSGGGGAGLNSPAPPPAAASAPAAASGKPWDSTAERQWGSGEQKYNDIEAELGGNWQSREDWYGLGATKNPYSQAALLERRHEIDRRTNTNTAGLGLYSGALINAQAGADRDFSVNNESLRAAFNAEREDNERKKEQAKHEWEAEQAQINEEAVERAEEVEPAPAPGPEPGGGGGSGGGKKGGKKGSGKGKGGGSGSGGTTAPSGKGKGKK